ncbi:MAG: hypothetical protein Tsb0013_23260 [Phycisphaerales bacterium]
MNDQHQPSESPQTDTPQEAQGQQPQTPAGAPHPADTQKKEGEDRPAPVVSQADEQAARDEANAQVDAAIAEAQANKGAQAQPMTGASGTDAPSAAPSAPSPTVIDHDAAVAAKAAMELAAGGDDAKKPAIRGPRVVQGGREHRTGTVVSIGNDDIFLEFGPKELGVLPKTQLKEGQDPPKVGEPFEVVIERFEPSESIYVCSLPGAVQKAEWELLEVGQIVEARCTGTNKGGLDMEVAKHRAFMPASHVDTNRIEDLSPFVGEKMACKVIKIERSGRGNILLSRREIIKEERAQRAKELKDALQEGQEVEGVVRKIMPFGAFVDIGGIDGLLHVSDISHERVNKVEDVLKEGQQLKVKILKLDWENKRHALGLKQLEPDPWDEKLSEVTEGEVVTGRITKLLEFGCFVELAEGIEGLVHISELAWKRVEKTSDVVQHNNTVKVKVLSVDKDKRKISLSIKQAQDRPEGQGGGRGKGGPGGGRGRGRRGEDEKDTRTPDEILKETPQLRRLREQAKKKKDKQDSGGGLAGLDYLGGGLGDLKL